MKKVTPFVTAFLIAVFAIGYSEPTKINAQATAEPPVKTKVLVRRKVAEKPVLIATTLNIDTPDNVDVYTNAELLVKTNAKFVNVKAKQSLFSTVKIFEVVHNVKDEHKYVFTGPPGKFLITVTTFDPESGIADSEAVITLGKPGPTPNPDPTPDPDVDPDPTPGPQPVDGFAGDVRKMLQSMGPAYKKDKILIVADLYASIGSQGNDPARSQGWNLDTFRTKTKELLAANLTMDEIASMSELFFKPLANKQAQIFASRNLKATDQPGISKLWTETSEAIRAAAF